jgi:hexosaminidase
MDKAVIMQSKNDKESIYNIAIKGNPVVLSFGYELDQLYPARTLYSNDPLPPFEVHTDKEKKNSITSLQERNILGGELLMWTDLVSSNSIDSRIWPRAAAVAERLWSAQNMLDEQDMYKRLDKINLLLQEANLTHLSNSNAILSQVSGQHDINALKVLVNVIEPYKGNLRNQGMQLYKTYSPYSLITDAAVVDAYDARQFRNFVNSYNHTRSASDKAEIDKYLRLWRENHNEFLRISYGVPTLRYLIKMSENLSLLANVGLDALKHIETKINVQKSWYESNLLVINTIRRYQEANMSNPQSLNDARCELAIIDDILLLLDLTNPDLAKKRQHDEAQLKGKN